MVYNTNKSIIYNPEKEKQTTQGYQLYRNVGAGQTVPVQKISEPATNGNFYQNVPAGETWNLNNNNLQGVNSTAYGLSGGSGGYTPSINSAGGSTLLDVINNAYEAEQSYLDDLGKSSRKDATTALDAIRKEASLAKQNIEGERTNRRSEIEGRRTEAKQDQSRSQARIKQNLGDLRQSFNAQLSAMGGGVSSTGEALGERLGRIGAQQTGDLRTATFKVMNAIQEEANRVEEFYNTRLANLENNLAKAERSLNDQLQSKLSAINASKFQSKQARETRRYEAFQEYQNQRSGILNEAMSVKGALDDWASGLAEDYNKAMQYQVGQTPSINAGAFGNQDANTGVGAGTQETTYLPQVRLNQNNKRPEEQYAYGVGAIPASLLG